MDLKFRKNSWKFVSIQIFRIWIWIWIHPLDNWMKCSFCRGFTNKTKQSEVFVQHMTVGDPSVGSFDTKWKIKISLLSFSFVRFHAKLSFAWYLKNRQLYFWSRGLMNQGHVSGEAGILEGPSAECQGWLNYKLTQAQRWWPQKQDYYSLPLFFHAKNVLGREWASVSN